MTIGMGDKRRVSAAMPFLIVATLAMVGAGGLAAATAHAPTQPLVWMVAYLVLVAGVAQAALGSAQAWFSVTPPSLSFRNSEFALFNAGNIGVIVGTLGSAWIAVLVGTLLFTAALAMFLHSSSKSRAGWPSWLYRVLLAILFAGSVVGLLLSAARHLK